MTYHIDLQHASNSSPPISDECIISWAELTLKSQCENAELTIRFVDEEEITQLNTTYRHKNKATNVLAFPANIPTHIQLEAPFLGDVIICPDILQAESKILGKPLVGHWAHITIHGILHLLGYDHINEDDEKIMQAREQQLMETLGFGNPYQQTEDIEVE